MYILKVILLVGWWYRDDIGLQDLWPSSEAKLTFTWLYYETYTCNTGAMSFGSSSWGGAHIAEGIRKSVINTEETELGLGRRRGHQ